MFLFYSFSNLRVKQNDKQKEHVLLAQLSEIPLQHHIQEGKQ
jgi:hypothetical protein